MPVKRPRQILFIDRCIKAIDEKNNTLGVAPTGAGKTLLMSWITGELMERPDHHKTLVCQHREELVRQNLEKFRRVNMGTACSIVAANSKSWRGDAVFAMVQTLSRPKNLQRMPKDISTIVVDETHRVAAKSYQDIIGQARENNPDLNVIGVTATPGRGDRKKLRQTFDNIGDQIMLGELINDGHLVPPKTFVIDVGVQDELRQVKKKAVDFDMDEVDKIMNHQVITDEVIRHWKEKAGDRQTVVFCSSVDHAINVCRSFSDEGIKAGVIYGDMGMAERRNTLARYANRDLQVIVNCMVLTEGWDDQPTSCVILLRPSSFKSTFVQMVGRGLRTVDPELYPDLIKTDCIVLDFGTSSIIHGSLEQEAEKAIEPERKKGKNPYLKTCPDCGAEVPARASMCDLCGYVWEDEEPEGLGDEKPEITKVALTEIDLLSKSSLRWIDLFGNDQTLFAGGFNAWAGCFFHEGNWYAVGGGEVGELRRVRILNIGDRMISIARCDDYLSENETEDSAKFSRRAIKQMATTNQLRALGPGYEMDFGMNKYHASCLINYRKSEKPIIDVIYKAANESRAAA